MSGDTNKLSNEREGNFEGGKYGSTKESNRKNATNELTQNKILVISPLFFNANRLYRL